MEDQAVAFPRLQAPLLFVVSGALSCRARHEDLLTRRLA